MSDEKRKGEYYKIEGERLERSREWCPKCGVGVFLAQHKDRVSCGRCGYTEFKTKVKKKGGKKKGGKKKGGKKKEGEGGGGKGKKKEGEGGGGKGEDEEKKDEK